MYKLVTLFLMCFSIGLQAQTVFDFKKDMVWIPDANLFVCKYEVTNLEYRTFTNELLKDTVRFNYSRKEIFDSYYPDTMVWIDQFKHHMGDGMYSYYYWLPSLGGHPVVGVRYEGAVRYCEWLTEKYGNGEYRFRLPTQKEFIQYAHVSPYKIAGGIESSVNSRGEYLINYKPNIVNMDDSISEVYYNPHDRTFMRIYNDTIGEYHSGDREYKYYVKNYLNSNLYIGLYKKRFTYKVEDSLTFYDKATDTYYKVKPVFNTMLNYYKDGFIYTSPSRAMKTECGVEIVDSNGIVDPDFKVIFSGKSTFPADKNGLYDLAGNVSEMVYGKGYAMGGNWDSEWDELNYDYGFTYENTNVLVGFRIVAERIK